MPDTSHRVRLRSGHHVLVRQLRSDDRERLAAAAVRLSDESRYRRYHNQLRELPDSVLDRLLDVDHHDTEAIVAVDPDTGEIVGGARFARDPDRPEVADLAVVVVDEWQRRGLAAHLLWRLAQRASEEHVHEFTALILATNLPTLELVQRLGPVAMTSEGTTVTARMDLDEWPDQDHSGAVESLLDLLGDGDVALVMTATMSWLGLAASPLPSLLIPVSAVLGRVRGSA